MGPRNVAEIEVPAQPEQVWEAITDPELSRRYYFLASAESDWKPGSPFAYRMQGGVVAEEGTVLEAEPPRRLRLESRLVFSPAVKDDPPHRVTWEIEPAGSRTRVRMTRDGYPGENATYKQNAAGIELILRGLKLLLDPEIQAQVQRLNQIGKAEVRELTPELHDDFMSFFDNDAFKDNPAWSFCYCMEPHVPPEGWADATAADNRQRRSEMIRSGRGQGLLAYVDGKPAGWCNVAARTSLLGLNPLEDYAVDDPERVGSIACFVIAAPFRRHGVARLLLDAACHRLQRQGLKVAEAYPRKESGPDASAFRGPLSMYLAAGFEPHKETPRTVIVRKSLPSTT